MILRMIFWNTFLKPFEFSRAFFLRAAQQFQNKTKQKSKTKYSDGRNKFTGEGKLKIKIEQFYTDG
jgi:hypothetical protein